MWITSIPNLIILFSLYITIINAVPAAEKRQDQNQDLNFDFLTPYSPLPATNSPETREYTLKLSRAVLAPDGYSRTVWTSNDQYPGPMIRANKGDTLLISLQNNLDDFVTIHWHGLFQSGTTYYDGVSGLTQCLIPSGTTFVYNFTANQYGTYWWHSHYVAQYADGLRGPLIIHDPNDPYLQDYDEEFVLTVSDWHHTQAEELVAMRMTDGYQGFNPIPDSGLISGRGRYDCSQAPKGSNCTSNNPLAVYVVEKGKRYRFRIINTSAEAPYTVSIDQHPLRIIEVEGENVKPVIVNKLNIAVGQRYSVIVTANETVGNFWIRATIIKQCLHSSPFTINVNSALNFKVTGILRYQGASDADPETQDWDEKVLDCRDVDHNLLKLNPPRPPPANATDIFTLVVNFTDPTPNAVSYALINNNPFIIDLDDPTVNKIMQGGNINAFQLDQIDPDQNAFVYDTEGGVVEINIMNMNGASHPFHLHGHNFYIMGHGDLGNGSQPDPSSFNLVDAAVRDTVTVLGNSWTTLRYEINNPGVWAFHCHIEWHLEMGMFGQLIERPSLLKNDQIPDVVKSICPKDDNEKRAVREFRKRHYGNVGRTRVHMIRGAPY